MPHLRSILFLSSHKHSTFWLLQTKLSVCSLFFLAFTIGVSAPAHAQLFADNQARSAILDLRQRYLTLVEENTKMRETLATTQKQVDDLRTEVTRARTRSEQLTNDLAEMRRQMNLPYSEEKIDPLMPENTLAAGAAETQTFAHDAEDPILEKTAYDAALNKFRASDYTGAQSALRAYLEKYPQSPRRISALYWLGNTDYALRGYRNAMNNYRAVVTQAPNHERAPEAMLALSACQIELRDTAAARSTLEKLISTYPRSEAAQAAQDRLARLR